jgi:trehalose synthase
MAGYKLLRIEDFRPLIGDEAVDRILAKAERLKGLRVLNMSSTYYGGGVAELLTSLTLLMNSAGIKAEWRIIQGTPDFFSITKKMHNALQGAPINFSEIKQQIYEQVIFENAIRNRIEHDFVIVHDPQPLPLIEHFSKCSPWIWRCHIDLTKPHAALWKYLRRFIEKYDAMIVSREAYRQKLPLPQLIFPPAINPFTAKNRRMSASEMDERLAHYKIPTSRPLVVQISRFDPWKDPGGVIRAFKIAQREIDATLVLVGNFATDDPEGASIYEAIQKERDEHILVMAVGDDSALINALQTRAAVVLQKSIREGFGLTVSEAMWKGTPVIGGRVGGICDQIDDGVNGFLVNSIEEAAERIVQVVKDPELGRELGRHAHEKVRTHFLLSRYFEQYLDLFSSFETKFRFNPKRKDRAHLAESGNGEVARNVSERRGGRIARRAKAGRPRG